MDTRWKKWTAHKSVKIISFILVIVLSFILLNRAFATIIREDETGVLSEIILAQQPIEQHIEQHVFDFDEDMLSVYLSVRNEYVRDLVIAVVSVVLIITLLVIMVFGAGRRYGCSDCALASADAVKPRHIHFLPVDRPFLDISLAAIFIWAVLMLRIAYEMSRQIMRHNNVMAINMLLAAGCVLIGTPVLLWILSFAKRIKAGALWRHTLIYALPRFVFKVCGKFAKSLWAGTALTTKCVIITVGIFFVSFFAGVWAMVTGHHIVPVFLASVIITAVAAVLIFRYARRIYNLEKGAGLVCGGDYSQSISVGGGALGSIADAINNIGAGINQAVEQRMKSERLKTELITNVSHDIRTPLTSIITYTDLLRHEGLDCEKAPEYLDVLISKSQRLKTLIDELFEAAKAATGNIEVNITQLDIVSLISQVMGEMDSAITSSGLDIRFNHPEHLMVNADGRLMWRIMENLLSNVLKYALAASRVYLDVSAAEASCSRIELKNISATELNVDPAELTERFKRGDEARTDGGSGLGLSIVQSFVEVQGGKFEIAIDGDLFKATIWIS